MAGSPGKPPNPDTEDLQDGSKMVLLRWFFVNGLNMDANNFQIYPLYVQMGLKRRDMNADADVSKAMGSNIPKFTRNGWYKA